ncbi:MAG TPA: ABC-2 family transporter protein [Polyangiaceae bacterium]|nr:ABC-2 family transporter protein [Polyangiaceae bacterium]
MFVSSLRLTRAYFYANIERALEYGTSFAGEVCSMLINDVMWLTFWVAFFDRFPVADGWGRAEVVTLWAVVATGFGLATTVFGNAMRLAGIIARGELDVFLTRPVPVLLHVLVSRMSFVAWGDVIFGVGAFTLLVRPSPTDGVLFAVLAVSDAALFVGFAVVAGSLAFWLHGAEGIAGSAVQLLITFSTYPTSIFRGALRVVLFTILPAGVLAFVPIKVLAGHEWRWLALHIAVSTLFVVLGAQIFARGLRRYESGNHG